MQSLRKILFYIFSAVYIILCPLIILYAFGYIVKPGTKEGIVKTGLIYVATAPTGATVYLNGEKNNQITPATLEQLTPGSYVVGLDLTGYIKWQETLLVEAEKATVLDKILLVPEKIEPEKTDEETFTKIITMPKTEMLAAVKTDKLGEGKAYSYVSSGFTNLLPEGSAFEELKIADSFSQEGSFNLLFRLDEKYVLVNAQTQENKEITELFPYPPEQIKWEANGINIFSYQKGFLNKIDVQNNSVYPEILKNIKGFGLFQNTIYYIKDDNTFSSVSYDASNENIILADANIGETLFGGCDRVEIGVFPNEIYVFTNKKGELLTNKLPYKFIDRGTRGYVYDQKNNKLAAWTNTSIAILSFSTEDTQDAAFQKPPELRWVYTKGKDIRQVFWVYEGAHILFRDGKKAILLEMDDYKNIKEYPLFNVKERSDMYYSEKEGAIFFLEEASGKLKFFQLRPQAAFIPMPFQDTKEGKLEEKQR